MTINEFLHELYKCRSPHWSCADSRIRYQDSIQFKYFCPVTFLAYKLHNMKYEVSQYQDAGILLGLSLSETESIATAADSTGEEYRELRNQILFTLFSKE